MSKSQRLVFPMLGMLVGFGCWLLMLSATPIVIPSVSEVDSDSSLEEQSEVVGELTPLQANYVCLSWVIPVLVAMGGAWAGSRVAQERERRIKAARAEQAAAQSSSGGPSVSSDKT
ncbi:MAG: hypothetical protein GYB68_04875 [Chloroflexi bacterium]|nr:hypothetical protein [Chloroflexota bacterium]